PVFGAIPQAPTTCVPSHGALTEVTNNSVDANVGRAKRQGLTQGGGKKKKAKTGPTVSTSVRSVSTVLNPTQQELTPRELSPLNVPVSRASLPRPKRRPPECKNNATDVWFHVRPVNSADILVTPPDAEQEPVLSKKPTSDSSA
ncbi:hypothetical protein FRC03_002991, partial [Tulasnella sp. 419]